MNIIDKLKSIKVRNQYWTKELTEKELKELYNITNFLPEKYKPTIRRIYAINNRSEICTCPVCGSTINKIDSTKQDIKTFCSNKCRRSIKGLAIISESQTKTCIEKYGKDYFKNMGKLNKNKTEDEKSDILEKRKNTCVERYGVENTFQNENFKIKSIETCQEKYGVDHYTQSTEYKDRYISTCQEKYGVDNIFQLKEVKNIVSSYWSNLSDTDMSNIIIKRTSKAKITRREHHFPIFVKKLKQKNIIPLFNIDKYINFNEEYEMGYKCEKCNKKFKINTLDILKIYCPYHRYNSLAEFEIKEWLISENEDLDILLNKKFTFKKENNKRSHHELDLYLPDFKLGIEYHGLYWHSDIHKDKEYHKDKYEFFKKQGITVIQIFENEWSQQQEIVKSIIRTRLSMIERKLYGRKCTIRTIKNDEYKLFCTLNHLQGYGIAKVRLGLFNGNELVQVMSFSKSRYNKEYEWENIRTCTLLNTVVVGGFSKLLKYFKNNYDGSIISYVDVRYFTGGGYLSNGFEYSHHSNPNFFYFKKETNAILESRQKYQKHKLKHLFDNFNPDIIAYENMLNNKYLRIFDAGNLVLISK